LRPFSLSCPRPPREDAMSRFSVIGVESLTSDPETCTDVALSAAAFVAETISSADFDATPLSEEEEEEEEELELEEPHPAAAAPGSASAMRRAVNDAGRPIGAATLEDRAVGHPGATLQPR